MSDSSFPIDAMETNEEHEKTLDGAELTLSMLVSWWKVRSTAMATRWKVRLLAKWWKVKLLETTKLMVRMMWMVKT